MQWVSCCKMDIFTVCRFSPSSSSTLCFLSQQGKGVPLSWHTFKEISRQWSKKTSETFKHTHRYTNYQTQSDWYDELVKHQVLAVRSWLINYSLSLSLCHTHTHTHTHTLTHMHAHTHIQKIENLISNLSLHFVIKTAQFCLSLLLLEVQELPACCIQQL